MKINWKVRMLNKNFWVAIIPAVLILLQAVLKACGIEFQIANIQESALNIINALFTLLAILGIVTDPTTQGVGDSEQALTYERPKGVE